MIHRPQRYKIMLGLLLGLIISMIVFGIAYFYYLNHESKLREKERANIRAEAINEYLENNPTTLVYALLNDKRAGEALCDADLMPSEISASLVPADAVTEPSFAIGKVMRSDMKKNTILVESLYYEEKDYPIDMRMMEYTVINLPQKLEINHFVDIRIMFPTGMDFIVLSKKRVVDLNHASADSARSVLWLHTVEEEILRMASAIVDASLVEGAIIYAVPYVAPDVQDEAIRTYPTNLEVQGLILQDPNIVTKAVTQLEARNRKLFEDNINQSYEYSGKQKIFPDGNSQALVDLFKAIPAIVEDSSEALEGSIEDGL